MEPYVTVLIPAYNEEKTILHTINAVKQSKFADEILIIDDGSKDNTPLIISSADVNTVRLKKNHGKGYALKYGMEKVIDRSEIIVFLDADLGQTAKEVDKLIIPIINNECDMTIAKFGKPKKKGGFGFVKLLARKGVKYLTDIDFPNCLSGQRAFKTEILRNIKKIPSNFGVEIGMTIDVLRLGYRIKEIEVNMKHRETGRNLCGFLHRGKQFYQILWTLIDKSLG